MLKKFEDLLAQENKYEYRAAGKVNIYHATRLCPSFPTFILNIVRVSASQFGICC